MRMQINKELMIGGNAVTVVFEILPEVRELMLNASVDIVKLINSSPWEVMIFEELMAENADVHAVKKLRLVINGMTDNKSGKTINVPLAEVSDQKPLCDVTDSGVVLTGFTIHYWIFDES
jgi:hypothetical protein